ncbi:MAG: hypothetical protein AAGD01_03880 [Acidobacteriota bacterium]
MASFPRLISPAPGLRRSRRLPGAGGGFTLVEMLVTLLLVLLVLVLSMQLLRSSGELLASSADSDLGRRWEVLHRQLRHDLQSAPQVASLPLWSSGGLALDRHPVAPPGGTLVWSLDRGRLLRDRFDAEGERDSRRVLLDGVLAWRHRRAGSLIEVEVTLDAGERGEVTKRWEVALRNQRRSNSW